MTDEHKIQRLTFDIIRTKYCSECKYSIISVIEDEDIRRRCAYQHAKICLTLKEAGIKV